MNDKLNPMRVLAVASQKGGSGKTTLAGHIAVQAEISGFGPVALVDMDPQGSLSSWWNERTQERPYFARTSVSRLATDIESMRDIGIRLLVIDTPPAITATIAQVIDLADLVLVPMRPSPHDLRAVGATIEIVEQVGKSLVFVLNGATPRARTTTDAISVLSGMGVLAPAIVHQRADFAASMIDGRTVMEVPGSERSSREIEELWEYLGDEVFRNDPGAVPSPMDSGAKKSADDDPDAGRTPEVA